VSESATVRRASTDAAIAVCMGATRPMYYLKVKGPGPARALLRSVSVAGRCQVLFNSLFGLTPASVGVAASEGYLPEHAVLGALLAFRKVMIHFRQAAKQSVSTEQVRGRQPSRPWLPRTPPGHLRPESVTWRHFTVVGQPHQREALPAAARLPQTPIP
jgi:hypothetical protein